MINPFTRRFHAVENYYTGAHDTKLQHLESDYKYLEREGENDDGMNVVFYAQQVVLPIPVVEDGLMVTLMCEVEHEQEDKNQKQG